MEGALNDKVNAIASQFNASQSDYKIVPVYKGQYDESLAAGIAAFRSGNAPAILQVFEVGTATMMNAKGAIKPVATVMKDAGEKFDPKAYIPAVAGYYTSSKGEMMSFPFNSSTTVMYYSKDAFRKAGLDPNKPPATWQEVATDSAKLKAAGVRAATPPTGSRGYTLRVSPPGTTSSLPRKTMASGDRARAWRSTRRCTSSTSPICSIWRRRATSCTAVARMSRRPSSLPGNAQC